MQAVSQSSNQSQLYVGIVFMVNSESWGTTRYYTCWSLRMEGEIITAEEHIDIYVKLDVCISIYLCVYICIYIYVWLIDMKGCRIYERLRVTMVTMTKDAHGGFRQPQGSVLSEHSRPQ